MQTVEANQLRRFTHEVFEACGAPADEAAIVADHLVTANLMGVDSHGIIRVAQYVEDIQEKAIVPGAAISVIKETETTAVVDGSWNFGLVVSQRAVDTAMEKARAHHVACVLTERCGHAGRLGTYTQRAAERGFICLAVCNSPRHGHFVPPWGGRKGRLSTNPIAYAVPTSGEFPIVSDFSTAAAPEGKIRLYREQGKELPEGWIIDAEGRPSKNPSDFYGPPLGGILPFGGVTGYRGYALSILVEILGSTLAGKDITIDRPGNDLAFIVIDVSAFIQRQQFYLLVNQLKEYLKSSPPVDGLDQVLLPGELEFRTLEIRRRKGIPIDDAVWEKTLACAQSLGISWGAEAPSGHHR
jgi:LDH2 family malate/lactate/ureidoglycolate dehydrogenase